MRFLDANVILYDYLQLERKLDPKTLKLKESAHKIMKNIKEGKEKVNFGSGDLYYGIEMKVIDLINLLKPKIENISE